MSASKTLRRVVAARTAMLWDQPLWGMLSLRLRLIEDPSCKTAWTNGRDMGFSPAFVEKLSMKELQALIAHEVEHCTRGHCWRRGGRDPKRWNIAADRVINPDLRDASYQLPKGALYELEASHLGKSAEWVYARLPESTGGGGKGTKPQPSDGDEEQGGSGGAGEDEGEAGDFGEVRDAPTTSDKSTEGDGDEGGSEAIPTEEDWRQAVQEAAAAVRGQGRFPGAAERMVHEAARTRIDWRAATHRWAQEMARADYTWRTPSPRYLPQGLYMPSLRSEQMGKLAVIIDTSGSVDEVMLNEFGGQLQAIADEVMPREVVVMSADAAVQRIDTFVRGEPIVIKPKGGGGTDFRPAFEAIAEMEEPPVGVIYLTDMYGTFPEQDPGMPVLWVSVSDWNGKLPFGELITVN